jgi:apolipoprotein D and lipocalin family protein
MMKPLLLVSLSLMLNACASGSANMKPLEVVQHVEINRYLGTWYEIARYPNRFQKNCHGSRAEYSLRPDGDIQVLNSCRKNGPDGPLDSAKGKAWVVDRQTNAKLKVRFFWPFSGDYWIIDLGKNYEYAVVGEPDRDYLWILSRRPEIEDETYRAILARLEVQGYDPAKLIRD